MRALTERRRVDVYAMDMIWRIARTLSARWGGNFTGDSPSCMEYELDRNDTRTAQQIKNDLLRKLKA